jgi:long-subunit acyl-CoA synthetase (AMP-forming)
MSTVSSTPLPLALRATTLCEAFVRTASERPDDVALRTPRDAMVVTWAEYAERVERIAAGLLALGVERGDTIALMLLNRPEFHLVDTAALHAGAIPFSLYNTSSLDQAHEVLENAQPVVAVTERALLPLVAAAARAQPSLRHVVLVDGRAHNTLSLQELEERGASGLDLRAAARATEPDDVATLVYTSGASGAPKGVELTHANLLAAARAAQERLEIAPAGRLLSYLPAAHIVDRWSSHYHGSIGLGCTVTCVPDPRQVLAVLPDARPTMWGGVPRVLEKLRAALVRRGVDDPGALTIEERIVLRERLGLGALRWLAGGAAPVSAPVLEYFGLLGVPIAEMWGMSETAGPGLANPPRAIRDGTCGLPVDGMELRLAGDGELLVRGPMVMRGYRGQRERTRRAFTADGWLRTGDIATMDEDGYVAIVDRKKDIIISSAGKNMAPQRIERTLAGGDPRIAAVIVIGDNRPYNVALVVLEPSVDPDDPAVREAVSRALAEGNRRLSRAEQVKRWTILPGPWSMGGDEITPTGKPRRAVIAAKYAEEIDALYAGPGESRLAEL